MGPVIGRRPAWCPRCDEVRQARPGSVCPTCSARLVALPRGSGQAALLARRDALLAQARSWLPALRVAGVAAVLLGLLAGAFVAGRSSSPASAAPAAPPTTAATLLTTPGGRTLSGSVRDFGWRADHGQVSLLLRRVFATGDTSSVTFEATGLQPGWMVEAVRGLRILDARGRELGLSSIAQDLPAFRSREPAAGVSVVTVSLQQRVDPDAVARVSVDQLILGQQSEERLLGTLTDPDLKRRTDATQPPQETATTGPATCPSCSLQVRCAECQTIRLAGATYRRGQVALLLTPAGRAASGESVVQADVLVASSSGQIGSLLTGTSSGGTIVSFDGNDLAAATQRGQSRMSFSVTAQINRMRTVAGPWEIDQGSGSR
jgi:hypothetical protein